MKNKKNNNIPDSYEFGFFGKVIITIVQFIILFGVIAFLADPSFKLVQWILFKYTGMGE